MCSEVRKKSAILLADALKDPGLLEKLKKIRFLLLDVDGILTDGKIFWQEVHGWTRFYNIKDGYGILRLKQAGIEVGILTAGKSEDVKKRAELLKIKNVFLGHLHKENIMDEVFEKIRLNPEQVAYMGDDMFDVPVFGRVGLSITVPDVVKQVLASADIVTQAKGGEGAVRELCEGILEAQNLENVVVTL